MITTLQTAEHQQALAEFRRVFGLDAECDGSADGVIILRAADWPDAFAYVPQTLIRVLSSFATGSGLTERGDAAACAALDQAGALIEAQQ